MRASDDNAWHCKHYAGRGEKSFYESGAALTEDMGMHVSKMWESIETQIQASLKTAQDLSVDLNHCVNDVLSSTVQTKMRSTPQSRSLSFALTCRLSDHHANSVGARTCTGSGDPPSAIPFCYTESKLGERVNLKVNSFDSEAGSFDLTGSGPESISCLGKSFSKSGQDLVADCT